MENISQFGNIHAVVGGFHGFSEIELLANVPVIIPTHCTKKKLELLKTYPKQTELAAAGMEFHL
jgi:7,8-dihydropterin-6-yl-methyl-4-(beta-D-ribofuranosyl)aminobenzene 5'-phosphate synthase